MTQLKMPINMDDISTWGVRGGGEGAITICEKGWLIHNFSIFLGTVEDATYLHKAKAKKCFTDVSYSF